MINFKTFITEGQDTPSIIKQMKTKAFAKKFKMKFHRILTTAGDDVGLSTEEDGTKISPKGYENFRTLIKGVIANGIKPTGTFGRDATIAKDVAKKITDEDILQIVNVLADEWSTRKKQ